jgi:hypothetical protein
MVSCPTSGAGTGTTNAWTWPNSYGPGMTTAFPAPSVSKEELLVALIAIAKINDNPDAIIERLDAKEKEA